ncbi:MAG: ISNCY family transposase [Pseudomonadota bacterium]
MTELVTLSKKELNRLDVIQRVVARRMTQVEAAQYLGVTDRQIRRLVDAYKTEGAQGLVSAKGGKRSNHQLASDLTDRVVALIEQHYADFGPTLAHEKLVERHGLLLSVESVRQLMINAGLWQTRKQRAKRVYQPRYRRDCLGELIQIDGSSHPWFEERGDKCTLLVFIDDATSTLMHAQFVCEESTFSYFTATHAYLERHGKPVAFYSDQHSTFRVNKKGATTGNGMTQFGRAMHELNIDIICANSSQAKGRVERANKTLQERLVIELRLENIHSMAAANAFLPQFIDDYNRRFAKPPKNDKDVHRPLSEHNHLDRLLSWQEQRTVSNSLTIQYDRVLFLLAPTEFSRGLKRQKVTVYDYPDGRLEIGYEGQLLPYTVFDKVSQVNQAEIVSNKRLGSALAFAKQRQKSTSYQRSKGAPHRQDQGRNLFI